MSITKDDCDAAFTVRDAGRHRRVGRVRAGGLFGLFRTRPRRGPHGRPSADDPTLDVSLDDIRPGEACRVVSLHCHGPVRRRLLDMGIVPDVRVEVIRNAPLRDPVEIRVHNTFMTLRRVEAARIAVVRIPAGSVDPPVGAVP